MSWYRKGVSEQSESESIEIIRSREENGRVPYGQNGADGGSRWMVGTGQTEIGLDGSLRDEGAAEGYFGEHCCIYTFMIEFHNFLVGLVFFLTTYPRSGGLSPGEGWDAVS